MGGCTSEWTLCADEKNQLKVEFFLLSIDDHKGAVHIDDNDEVEWAHGEILVD